MSGIAKNTYNDLSRCMSHALRHEPWIYELELDDEGWVSVQHLLEALQRQRSDWNGVDVSDLERVIESSTKPRHELRGMSIRALYGHSVPGKLRMVPAEPPNVLYHGTAPETASVITTEGLKPMGRQYVHLSTDKDMALEVGRRKSQAPVILAIDAAEAHQGGTAFYAGNEKVWLADEVPSAFIKPIS